MSTLNGNNNATDLELEQRGSSPNSGKHPPPLTTVIDVHNGVTAASDENHVRESSENSLPNVGKNKTKTKKIGPKVLHRVKLVCLFVAMVIVWALVSIPIVLFHTPVGIMEQTLELESNQSSNCSVTLITIPLEDVAQRGFSCRDPDDDIHGLCREPFNDMMRNCNPQDFTFMKILQNDQPEAALSSLNALNGLGTEKCKAEGIPFLCAYFFGLCDSTGNAYVYRPSSSQCTEISTGVCTREWTFASLNNIMLPDCESLKQSYNESEDGSGELQPTTILAVDAESNQSVSCSCRKGFYCRNGSNLCYPECGSWKQFSDTTSTISDVFVILSAVIGALGSVAVLIIAVIRREKMYTGSSLSIDLCMVQFVFPLVFLVYQTIIYLVLVIFMLITFMGRVALYCRSQDLLESIEAPTSYCTITGIILSYGLFQFGLWGVFHVIAIYWKLQFPLHYRQFNTTGRIKYIHLAAVILGLVFALLPVITPIVDHAVKKSSSENSTLSGIGFAMTTVPPITCTTSNENIAYYSLAFPLNLILFVGTTLLLLVFWIIHKHQGLFKERITLSKSDKNKWFQISTAERKVLIVVSYYIIITDISLLSFSLAPRNSSEIINRVGEHFLCELTHPSEPCPRSFEELQYPYLTEIAFVLLSLFPFTVLNVLINFRELLVKIKKSTSSAVSKMMATSTSS